LTLTFLLTNQTVDKYTLIRCFISQSKLKLLPVSSLFPENFQVVGCHLWKSQQRFQTDFHLKPSSKVNTKRKLKRCRRSHLELTLSASTPLSSLGKTTRPVSLFWHEPVSPEAPGPDNLPSARHIKWSFALSKPF